MIPSRAHDVKPEKIMQQICKICLSDGRILDPFAGSGSTLAAAEREGYDWVCLGKQDIVPLRQRTSDLDEKTCR